jgi:hypothetical protein
LRLGELDRGNAELLLDGAPELPTAQTKVGCQRIQASPVVQGTRLDPAGSRLGGAPDGIDRGMPGRELGPAAQARPESVSFRQRTVRIETAPIAAGTSRRADRAAINPSGGHSDKKKAVESSVTRS